MSLSLPDTPAGHEASSEQDRLLSECQQRANNSLGDVVAVTSELFGSDVRVKCKYDPAFPADKYVVFCVDVSDPDTGLRLEQEWARRLRVVSSRWDTFKLSIRVTEGRRVSSANSPDSLLHE